MRRLLTLIALVAGTLLPATGAFGTPDAAPDDEHTGVGIRLVDAPVAARDNPRARVYIIDHVAPGTVIGRRIEVSNDTGGNARVAVYAAAADLVDGSFVGLEADTPNELSTWMGVSRPELTLAAGEKANVAVEIDVPADAAPGEQYAVIWAQTTSGAADGNGVTQVSRVGIRVYLSVGPGGEPASNFTIESFVAARSAAGGPMVQAIVHNTGGRALDLSGTLDLTDGPGGLSAGPFPVDLGTTLGIGQTAPVNVELDEQLPNGPWQAEIEITSGLLTESAHATITFPDAAQTGEAVRADPDGHQLWYWAGALVLALALLALVWTRVARPRRIRRARMANTEPELPVTGPLTPAASAVPRRHAR
ncbi:hypothetical protein [Nocardioides gansuensis]|uniref:hypothetical protein n=1 Tax=Nocardioides gansuensis TaxID=2138300 RepID=UPI001BA7C39C|nr:hypothetical protein [Nocardioides gansuensis]